MRAIIHLNQSGKTHLGRAIGWAAVLLFLALVPATPGSSQTPRTTQPALVIAEGAQEQRFTAAELLARPDAVTLSVDGDVYHHAVAYRAVPLLSLLGSNSGGRFDTIEAAGSDGFVTQIPLALIMKGAHGGAVAYIAVEDPAHPWPSMPHKSETAGPFYLVWEHPERSGVSSEQWPYQLVRLSYAESPVHRWPQLAVAADVPQDAPGRHGQEVFIAQCLPCHRMKGGGASDTGPDLGRPMSPTQYLTEFGLRAIIRNPKAVRTWPAQQMIGFDDKMLPDSDLDAVIAYLRAMAPAPR